MPGDISPAAWPGKTLPVMWMRCCGQTQTEDRMQHSFFLVFFYCNCILLLFCLCNFMLVGMYTVHCFCWEYCNTVKYICYRVFVCSEYKNNILNYFTTHYVCTVCSKCNTEQKKGLSHYDEWSVKCFPLIIVFYTEHISVQLILMNV